MGLCPRCVLAGAVTPAGSGIGAGATTGRHPEPSLERLAAAFPQLELVERIGAGGMGVVFKARQPRLDRHVALKILPESLAADPQFAERFHREARVLARLNHPNIVTVHDFGEAGGFFFLLMEYVDGVNLRDAMRAGRFTPAEALKIIPSICDALQFAHDEGILHRDIKPENILLDGRGRVKIADFGIAKLLGESKPDITLTASSATVGTPQYMAPEQIEHPRDVDHRADIYSLGVVFYEMLTGELPIGRFAPPSSKVSLDARVDEIVLRALAKERELRQQSAEEVGTQVQSVRDTAGAGGTAAPAKQEGRPAPASRVPHFEGPDFVLCNPRLPRMAQWITVYFLVVAPIVGLLGLSTIRMSDYVSPYAQFTDFLSQAYLVVATLGLNILGIVGALRLRRLHPTGPRWLRLTVWLSLAAGIFAMVLFGWAEHLDATWRTRGGLPAAPEAPLSSGDMLIGITNLVVFIFEIASLVWLTRHRHALAALFAEASPGSIEAAEERELTAPQSGSLRGVTWAAVLTAISVVAGLATGSAAAMYGMGMRQGAPWGGLGPIEVGILMLVLALIVVPGVGGAVLGWRGLGEARRVRGRIGGVGRAVFGTFGWPLVLLELAIVVGIGTWFWTITPGWVALLLTVIVGLACGELSMRAVWRWLRGVARGERAGRAPGWAHGLVALALPAAVVAAVPAMSIAFSNYIRSQMPEMVTRVRPDPAASAGGAERSAMQLGITFPGRTIVWLNTALLRDGELMMSPLTRTHVVSGGFDDTEGTLLVRSVPPAGGEDLQWELVFSAGGEQMLVACAEPRSAGVRWSPAGPVPPDDIPVNSTYDFDILRGRDAAGVEWRVVMTVQTEPLTPAFIFDGVRIGNENDWSGTASRETTAGTVTRVRVPAAPVVDEGGDRERLKVQLERAEAKLADVRARHATGQAVALDVALSERDVKVLKANLAGNPVEAARAALEYARQVEQEARKRVEVGVARPSELGDAQAEVRLREIDLSEAMRKLRVAVEVATNTLPR